MLWRVGPEASDSVLKNRLQVLWGERPTAWASAQASQGPSRHRTSGPGPLPYLRCGRLSLLRTQVFWPFQLRGEGTREELPVWAAGVWKLLDGGGGGGK